MTDGYEGYGKVCAEYGLTAVGCWAHVRRKFDEAIKLQGLLGPVSLLFDFSLSFWSDPWPAPGFAYTPLG